MTTADEFDEVPAKCEATHRRLTSITVTLTETEVGYLLLGLSHLAISRPVSKAGNLLLILKTKLLSALQKAEQNG